MKDRVKKVISEVFNIDIELINNESSPDNIESWDSLKHMNLIVALEEEFEDAMNYGQFTDPANVEQDKKDFTYENGDRFLDTNEDKMSKYLGFEIDTFEMSDDYTLGDPKGVEFVHSDEDFEGWMDQVGPFWD